MNKFSQRENELITHCWDEPDKVKINIDPTTKRAVIYNAEDNKILCTLRNNDVLAEQLIYLCDIKPTYKKL
jgi:hypothetical protein